MCFSKILEQIDKSDIGRKSDTVSGCGILFIGTTMADLKS